MYITIKKYRTLLLSIFFALLLGFSQIEATVTESLPLLGKIIFVDPGHGGRDPGAIKDNLYEKDLTLKIALNLQASLMEKGAIVYLTRDSDSDLSSKWDNKKKRGDLYRRIVMYRKKQADIYLSIHVNDHSNKGMRGVEVLYNPINKKNVRLGEILMNLFKKELNTTRDLKETNLYMYKNTSVPGVLIECGFISNARERKLLQNELYQKRLASIITTGIIEYFH